MYIPLFYLLVRPSIHPYPSPIRNSMILTHLTSFFYLAKITKLANSPAASKGGYMVVNTEWGAFNNSVSVSPSVHPIHTDFDTLLTPPSTTISLHRSSRPYLLLHSALTSPQLPSITLLIVHPLTPAFKPSKNSSRGCIWVGFVAANFSHLTLILSLYLITTHSFLPTLFSISLVS